jgi:hypothetical protein
VGADVTEDINSRDTSESLPPAKRRTVWLDTLDDAVDVHQMFSGGTLNTRVLEDRRVGTIGMLVVGQGALDRDVGKGLGKMRDPGTGLRLVRKKDRGQTQWDR